MSESQGSLLAISAEQAQREHPIQAWSVDHVRNVSDDTYPFTVVGTMHRRMDEPSSFTRYFILDCNTGARYYVRNAEGEVRTLVFITTAHEIAARLANGERKFTHVSLTVVKV